ncbi:hypothetical protein [Candidatus Magnetaquiglobus chichijimensis]|uniref:hypothetical protein n=1 Tax=Candidatus Magnetaquiglobus chichijimensis TaxID=3141448 RepID=UPI003B976076
MSNPLDSGLGIVRLQDRKAGMRVFGHDLSLSDPSHNRSAGIDACSGSRWPSVWKGIDLQKVKGFKSRLHRRKRVVSCSHDRQSDTGQAAHVTLQWMPRAIPACRMRFIDHQTEGRFIPDFCSPTQG